MKNKLLIIIATGLAVSIATIYYNQVARKNTERDLTFLMEFLEVKQNIEAGFEAGLQAVSDEYSNETLAVTQKVLAHVMSTPILNDIKAIYAKNLSPQTIRKMVKFYKSQVYLDFTAALVKISAEISEKIRLESQQFLDQITEDDNIIVETIQ